MSAKVPSETLTPICQGLIAADTVFCKFFLHTIYLTSSILSQILLANRITSCPSTVLPTFLSPHLGDTLFSVIFWCIAHEKYFVALDNQAPIFLRYFCLMWTIFFKVFLAFYTTWLLFFPYVLVCFLFYVLATRHVESSFPDQGLNLQP